MPRASVVERQRVLRSVPVLLAPLLLAFAPAILAAPSRWIPVVAHAGGAAGTFFVTDLRLHNPTAAPMSVTLRFMPTDTADPAARQARTVALEPREARAIDDVLSTLFETEGVGSLELTPSLDGLIATSRTYNANAPEGTYGQLVASRESSEAIGPGDGPIHLLHVSRSGRPGVSGFRSNVGFAETSGKDAEVGIEVLDRDGITVGEYALALPAYGHRQTNDVFAVAGAGDRDLARVRVTVVGGTGRILAYASVVDNVSSDQIFVPAALPAAGEASWVVGAAHASGEGGTFWVTDLRVANPSADPRTVRIEFLPTSGTAPAPLDFGLGAGAMLGLDDVVFGAFGQSGSGVLRVATEPEAEGGILVTARTYNTGGGSGTYGQLVPARPTSSAIPAGSAATALGAQKSGVPGVEGYRTNAGVMNVAEEAGAVWVELWGAEGVRLGRLRRDLAPREAVQWNDVFAATSAEEAEVAFARFTAEGDARILPWVSVVDNRSGDPIYVPGVLSGLDLPNLVVETPIGWPGPLVIGESAGATTDTELFAGDVAYVNWSVRNVGFHAIEENVRVELALDGELLASQTAAGLGPGEVLSPSPYPSFVLPAGEHALALEVDPEGLVAEADEADNGATRAFEARVPLPDLAPATPPGWSKALVVASSADAKSDSTVYEGGKAWIRWGVGNDGLVEAEAFDVVIELDGVEIARSIVKSLEVGEIAIAPTAVEIDVPGGAHTVTLRVDAAADVEELDENDNVLTRSFDWQGAADLEPFAPEDWSGPLVVTADSEGTSDSTVFGGSRVFVRWAAKNVGTGDSPTTFWVRLRVDGKTADEFVVDPLVEGAVLLAETALALDLTAGAHTFALDLDPTFAVPELDETDNTLERSVTVQSSTSTVELQPGATHPFDSPVVVSNLANATSTATSLHAGTTYFSFFAVNWGRSSTSATFRMTLAIDGTKVLACDVPAGLARDRSGGCRDLALSVPKGIHSVQLTVDETGAVLETVESNSLWTASLEWR